MIIQTPSLILGVIGNNGSNCLNNCNKIIIFCKIPKKGWRNAIFQPKKKFTNNGGCVIKNCAKPR